MFVQFPSGMNRQWPVKNYLLFPNGYLFTDKPIKFTLSRRFPRSGMTQYATKV